MYRSTLQIIIIFWKFTFIVYRKYMDAGDLAGLVHLCPFTI